MSKTSEEKYRTDIMYHNMIDHLTSLIEGGQFTPSELREMVIFACTEYEMRRQMRSFYLSQQEEVDG